jgi:hypothetical protein
MHRKALRVQWQLKEMVESMAETLQQLTYISSRHPQMSDSEIDRILSSARLHNKRNGITGLLMFNGHRFLQHLEGPAEAVEETYQRISADPRHRGVVLLSRVEAQFRAFSSWSMAFERIDSALPERRNSLVAQVQALVEKADPKIANHFIGYAKLTSDNRAA